MQDAVKDYEPLMSFGEDVAAVYDDLAGRGDEFQAVSFLEQLAGQGRQGRLG
jgi:hypothetical protein